MLNRGSVIAIGGNEDKSGTPGGILSHFVEHAGGCEARIVIVPFASSTPEERGAMYARLFLELGAASAIVLREDESGTTDFSPLEKATGVFVTGGDQSKLMLLLARHGCVEAIQAAVARGAVYAGTSAGAAAVSGPMITGWSRNRRGTSVSYGDGLALASSVIIDQHFSERNRLPRLQKAVTHWNLTGLGIDENTAAIFDAAGRLSVIGSGRVTMVRPGLGPDEEIVTLEAGDAIEMA